MTCTCGPDLISIIVHGGVLISYIGFVVVMILLWNTERSPDAAWVRMYLAYGFGGLLWFFVTGDIFRWAVRLVLSS